MIISVLIPTYRRPLDLSRCLMALEAQVRPADEMVIVIREGDSDTNDFLNSHKSNHHLRRVSVREPGVVAAMTAGLKEATGDVIALTDDDTAPFPDWLQRMEAHFAADPKVGGVGGRDWQRENPGSRTIVGKVQWQGRVIGNHHLGVGAAREVDVLKGANCAYLAGPLKQIGFESRLRGKGAQVHWELALGLAMRRAGWKLIYDPAVALDHYPATRFDTDTNLRGIFNAEGIHDSGYNETLILLSCLPWPRRAAHLVWAFLVGTRMEPGLLQTPRLMLSRDRHVWQRVAATFRGRAAAVKTMIREKSGAEKACGKET